MRAVEIIRKKRDGGELTPAEIDAFVAAASHGTWEKYQLSALLMAITIRGMTDGETAHLTRAMTDSGQRIDLSDIPGIKVDKHSTGGVGDKTSLILAPLAAACGVIVPMMSGRGLGHTGGTLDKLEAIPGFRVGLSIDEFRANLRKIGVAMISQTDDVAPADKMLYALRDVTGTVESIPLITASILSKKLAEGISALVMDVKCGRGAFMKTLPEARALAQSLVRVGTANGLKIEAVITAMDAPLGSAVGNAIEVQEAFSILEGNTEGRLAQLSILLAAKMVKLAGLAKDDADGEAQVHAAIHSGAGLAKFREMVELQGGDLNAMFDLHPKKISMVVARESGYIATLDAEKIGVAAMILGAGRERAEDTVDAVAKVESPQVGEHREAGQPLFWLATNRPERLATATELLDASVTYSSTEPEVPPLVLETLTS
jgi:pyrimidine-nucleoside phosphorylase